MDRLRNTIITLARTDIGMVGEISDETAQIIHAYNQVCLDTASGSLIEPADYQS